MRAHIILLLGGLLAFTGCAAKGELYTIKPMCLNRPCAAKEAPAGKCCCACGSHGADKACKKKPSRKERRIGLWFTRKVKVPAGSFGRRDTVALEVIWCPENQSDFSRCRTSIVSKEKYLEQFNGSPPARAEAAAAGSTRSAPAGRSAAREEEDDEEQPAALRAAIPPPKAKKTLINTDGKSLSDLGSANIARMWRWSGQRVILFGVSGGKVSGKLLSVNETGIELEGRKKLIKWNQVSSIGLAP